MNYPLLTLKSGKEKPLLRFHPWIFSGAIQSIQGNPIEGDIVKVVTSHQQFLGYGHFQPSTIQVRVFSFIDEPINETFWFKKIEKAIQRRKLNGFFNHNDLTVFRLIHGEGDGLPGFVVDYYDGTLVFQAHSWGMYQLKTVFANAIQQILGNRCKAIYDKSKESLPHAKSEDIQNGFIIGHQEKIVVNEYGNQYVINVVEGQKTGFFIDQRENRLILQQMAKGRSVLNLFCYSGGFSLAALQGEATWVESVDSSAKAIQLTNENVNLNFPNQPPHLAHQADVMNFLKERKTLYDIIVVDPPAFAKHIRVLKNGLKGYRHVNQLAFEKVKPDGFVFTFSCSQVVSTEDFKKVITEASILAKRKATIVAQLHQPEDHPINLYHPESEYLKGFLFQLE